MCGVAGVFMPLGDPRPLRQRVLELEEMVDLIGHRGPNESGVFVDDYAALGIARLSIVDIAGGTQPISDETRRWWIAYNGEVYNFPDIRRELETKGHLFATKTDTETVLRAWMEWGPESAARLEGGFAFVIYDRREKTACLVRDRMGKRPLFYRAVGEAFDFASEMKAFLARAAAPLSWDEASLPSIFTHWSFVDGDTPFSGVRQVRAGAIVRLDAAGASETIYANFPLRNPSGAPASFEDAAVEVRQRLCASVERRLSAEVDYALLLSGGLDSSILAQIVSKLRGRRLRTFSIGFEDTTFDESREQDIVAQRLGVENSRIRVGAPDIAEAFAAALWHAEIPQFRLAFVPMFLLARTIADAGYRVVLSGEGADEIFLGYDIFKETRLRSRWSAIGRVERRDRLRGLYPYLGLFDDKNLAALETVFDRSVGDPSHLFSHRLRIDNGRFAGKLLRAPADGAAILERAAMQELTLGADPIAAAQWLEVKTLLVGYLLSSQGDRMMFAHGVEPRNPFLAPDIAAFASSLPEHYLLGEDGCEKRLLKAAFADEVPDEIVRRPKQPYRSPGAQVFFHSDGISRNALIEEFAENPGRVRGPLDPDATSALFRQALASKGLLRPRQDQAFLLALSTAELDRLYVRGEGRLMPRVRPPQRRRVIEVSEEGKGAIGAS